MREYIENNREVLEELLYIDNQIMGDTLTIENLLSGVESYIPYSFKNSLFFYDGDPCITLKLMNSNIEDSVFYPGYSYLGVNRFLTNFKENIRLSMLKTDVFYEENQHQFDHIIVLQSEVLFEEVKKNYKNALFIAL